MLKEDLLHNKKLFKNNNPNEYKQYLFSSRDQIKHFAEFQVKKLEIYKTKLGVTALDMVPGETIKFDGKEYRCCLASDFDKAREFISLEALSYCFMCEFQDQCSDVVTDHFGNCEAENRIDNEYVVFFRLEAS